MPGKKKELPPLTELEERILERQLREQLGPTEEFWRDTLLNRPMERGTVPTPLAQPYKNPARPPVPMDVPSTEDPMYMYDKAEMLTKDPMPFTDFNPKAPIITYL